MRRRRRTHRGRWIAATALLVVFVGWFWRGGDADGATEAPPPIPNAGTQRNQMLAEMKRLNQQVAELSRLLRSGNVVVSVKSAQQTDARRPSR